MGFVFKPFETKAMRDALGSVTKELLSVENMRRYGQMAADMIKLRTRLGDGVSAEGEDKQRLKPLAESTKQARKRMQKRGKLSDLTTPNRSNLTATAQLLDSVQVTKASPGVVTIAPKGARQEGGTNPKVAEYVAQAGRSFMPLSRVEIKRINDEIKRTLREILGRLLTKTK
jgi:hypothetical protein